MRHRLRPHFNQIQARRQTMSLAFRHVEPQLKPPIKVQIGTRQQLPLLWTLRNRRHYLFLGKVWTHQPVIFYTDKVVRISSNHCWPGKGNYEYGQSRIQTLHQKVLWSAEWRTYPIVYHQWRNQWHYLHHNSRYLWRSSSQCLHSLEWIWNVSGSWATWRTSSGRLSDKRLLELHTKTATYWPFRPILTVYIIFLICKYLSLLNKVQKTYYPLLQQIWDYEEPHIEKKELHIDGRPVEWYLHGAWGQIRDYSFDFLCQGGRHGSESLSVGEVRYHCRRWWVAQDRSRTLEDHQGEEEH